VATNGAGLLRVAKVDFDALPSLARALGVKALPTVLVFSSGKAVDGFAGVPSQADLEHVVLRAVGVGKRADGSVVPPRREPGMLLDQPGQLTTEGQQPEGQPEGLQAGAKAGATGSSSTSGYATALDDDDLISSSALREATSRVGMLAGGATLGFAKKEALVAKVRDRSCFDFAHELQHAQAQLKHSLGFAKKEALIAAALRSHTNKKTDTTRREMCL